MIALRKVAFNDLFFLYYLRNQPETYEHFKNNHCVTIDEHIGYWANILLELKPAKVYIIVAVMDVGQLKIEKGEVSLSLLKEYWGQGLATEAVKLATREKGKYFAVIDQFNPASQKVFEKAGFEFKKKTGEYRKYYYYEKNIDS